MSEIDFSADLFDAYQKTAEHFMPPGFVLVGSRIYQTIGNVQQLFSDQGLLKNEMMIADLPDGAVKKRLSDISESVALDIPLDQLSTGGIRVCPFRCEIESYKQAILVVFDVPSWMQDAKENGSRLAPSISISTEKGTNRLPPIIGDHSVGTLETPRVIVWETDHQGNATFISKSEADFTGCTQEELLGLGWSDTLHPDDLEQCMATFFQAVGNAEPFSFICRRRRSDGAYFWFNTHGVPQFDSQNSFIGFKGFCVDCTSQIEVQSALADKHSMMRLVLDNSPYLSAFVDRDLTYRYANNNYAEFWNVAVDELVGMKIPELTGDFYHVLKPFLDRTLAGETVYHEISVDQEPLEGSRYLEVTHVPAFDASNRVIGFYCFVNDKTVSRGHEQLLQLVLNHSPAMILQLNTNLEIRQTNFQFKKRMGKSGAQIIGRSIREFLSQESQAEVMSHLSAALSGNQSSFEACLTSAIGSKIEVVANFVPELDAYNKIIGIYGLMLDDSELKSAQSDLRQTQARFELALEGSSIGVFEFDSERPDWLFADHIEDLLGFERGELKNSRSEVRKLIHPDDVEKNDNLRVKLSLGADSWEKLRQQLRIKNKKGDFVWFEVFSQNVARSDRELGRAGTIVNVNQLKMAQLESAEQVRRRDEFLAMLSHELRNPMAAIVLALDLLVASGSIPQEHQSAVDIMHRQSKQISRLLDDLLDVSRVTHNRIEFQMTTLDVNAIVKEVAAGLINKAKQKNQTLNTDLSDQQLMIEGDEARLRQVVSNLLENAIKYTNECGEIWVSTSQMEQSALISVRDNGIGIPNDLIGQVFDLFSQGISTVHRTNGGLGVGLFLVKHIVDAHDGIVIANSKGAGEGSQFDVRFPLSEKVSPQNGARRQHSLDGLNIVLVEDNNDTRNIISELLKLSGMSVTEFADGESASQRIPQLRPDVAIIDIGLPGKSGLDLATEFRNNRDLDETLLIALTGYGQDSDREMTAKAGFNLHLVKPADIVKLTDAIAENSSVMAR